VKIRSGIRQDLLQLSIFELLSIKQSTISTTSHQSPNNIQIDHFKIYFLKEQQAFLQHAIEMMNQEERECIG